MVGEQMPCLHTVFWVNVCVFYQRVLPPSFVLMDTSRSTERLKVSNLETGRFIRDTLFPFLFPFFFFFQKLKLIVATLGVLYFMIIDDAKRCLKHTKPYSMLSEDTVLIGMVFAHSDCSINLIDITTILFYE